MPPQTRNALNCIVDDAALLAGLRAGATDNLKLWVQQGAINIFVPLYTLERLNQLRSNPPPINLEARKTLEWLDHITSITENRSAGRVHLQGPDDQYETWAEVEKYLLPDTPLTSSLDDDDPDELSEAMEQELHVDDSTAPNEGEITAPQLTRARDHSRSSITGVPSNGTNRSSRSPTHRATGIPASVRPLLNFVVWRTHYEDAAMANNSRYILLTNEASTQKQAQKFGVRAKLLSQVRTAVARDGLVAGQLEEQEQTSPENQKTLEEIGKRRGSIGGGDIEDEEDEVLFAPVQRPSSSRNAQPPPDVWDPDHFGRTPTSKKGHNRVSSAPSAGRGGSPTASKATIHKPAAPAPAVSAAPRGRGIASSRGRGAAAPTTGPPAGRQPGQQVARPIDPDSYVRPAPSMRRGRAGFRKLWDPNT